MSGKADGMLMGSGAWTPFACQEESDKTGHGAGSLPSSDEEGRRFMEKIRAFSESAEKNELRALE